MIIYTLYHSKHSLIVHQIKHNVYGGLVVQFFVLYYVQKAFYLSVCFAKITFCFVCREIWANILDLPKGNRNFNMRTGMNESPKKLQHTRVLNFWNHYFVVINSRFYVYNSSLQLHFKLKKGVCMLWKRNAINLQDLLPTHGRKKSMNHLHSLFLFQQKQFV